MDRRGSEGEIFADIGPREVWAGGAHCSFSHDAESREPGELCCDRGEGSLWCRSVGGEGFPGVSLASDGEVVFVAEYPAISTGAAISAFDLDDGAPRWTRQAKAIGPQGHSEYFNVVQLRLVEDALIAYGYEAHGAYVEAMDPERGSLIAHRATEPPQVEWRWDEDAPEPDERVELELPGGGRCTLDNGDERRRLACEVAGESWARELEGDFVGRAALASDERHLAVASWGRISSGARVEIFELGSGAPLWRRELEGIGPQEHSKYSNLVALEIVDGVVEVRGLESHGRYVEGRELGSGALLWNVQWQN